MGEKASLTMDFDNDSGSEQEESYRSTSFNKIQYSGLVSKNRRHGKASRFNKGVILKVILTISLLANIVLFGLVFIPEDVKISWANIPCDKNSEQYTGRTQNPSYPEVFGDSKHLASVHQDQSISFLTSVKPPKITTRQNESITAAAAAPQPTPYIPRTYGAHSDCAQCPISHPNQARYRASAARYVNIFEDLSTAEIQAVYNYLARQTDLGIQPNEVDDTSHVFGIELHVPNKTEALNFIDGRGPKPIREARVVVERPNLPVPVIEEYVVGPLPSPRYHHGNPRRDKSTIPYSFLPTYGIKQAYRAFFQTVPPEMRTILQESYGATFFRCHTQCLLLLPQRTSSAYSEKTLIVLTAYYATDFVTLNPVDLMFVMKETALGSRQFQVDSIFYAGIVYQSFTDLITSYHLNKAPKARKTFPRPAPNERSNPGTMNLRGRKFPVNAQEGPREFEPEGKRFSVTGQHVQYLEWSFNLRMSTASGPQVWDVRWAGERIAYEISLQDVVVIYAGANPTTFYAHLSDSAFGLGDKAVGLVAGVDCPDHSTFLPQTIFAADADGPKTLPNAFCVFEHNNGVPLRRHRSDDDNNGRNYGGLVDRVLIVRTIIMEYNYDYIFDVVFHQNGAVEIKTYATGYVMSQNYFQREDPFGFRIHENAVGAIHHHLMNYKIDLDIQGRRNRYKTLDFVVNENFWPWYKEGRETFQQISFKHNLKRSEADAILRYDFSAPKYHIVYNEEEKNKFNNHRAYRIAVQGFSKQILRDEAPMLKSRRWAQYQMLATVRRDEEESSSSVFSMLDGASPHVDIDRYLINNENIVDKDLVFWVTVGFHHIPHTEDVPNTPTVGASATILLTPYNYFPECPSVGSRDAFRLDLHQSGGLLYQDYGTNKGSQCLPHNVNYAELLSNTSNFFP